MGRRPLFPRNSSSLSGFYSSDDEKGLLPRTLSPGGKTKLRVQRLVGHYKYRRVLLWTGAAFALLFLALGSGKTTLRRERLLDLATFNKDGKHRYHKGSDLLGSDLLGSEKGSDLPGTDVLRNDRTSDGSDAGHSGHAGHTNNAKPDAVYVVMAGTERVEIPFWRLGMPPWLKFPHLDGFYVGLKALVPASEYRPEHPLPPGDESPYPLTLSYTGLPTPTPFVPQPDYKSSLYTEQYHEVAPCYLDKQGTIPVPDLYAYNGVIQGQSEPVIGSHSLLGLRDDVCFDRFGRYGPYGLGYTFEEGGVEVGLDTEGEGNEAVWAKSGKINYDGIDWGDAQTRCYESNKRRFVSEARKPTATAPATRHGRAFQEDHEQQPRKKKLTRTAVLVRAYTGFQWTHHAVLNFRAMISELSLRSGGEYTVHFLVHVRDDSEAIFADPITAQRILDDNIPREFHGISTLWSEDQMRLIYPEYEPSFSNPAGSDVHGVYRSAHMAIQHFAMNHPEYEHFWNWELDLRWLGNYYELFDRLGKWSRQQSRVGAWERSAKYYIPRYHGSWANFTALVHNETKFGGRPAVLGPVSFPGRLPLRAELANGTTAFLPTSCTSTTNPASCGVGEDADLITLNPLFDVQDSGWIFSNDVTGYNLRLPLPPRRSAIVTASRLSRRLLAAMHEENWRLHHNMFSEMFPATAALHHGLKAVFAPHPVWVDRDWTLPAVDAAFNGGRDRSAGGKGSPFDLRNEHNHKGTSWYYHSEFAGLLWRRWLGYAERDGRGENGGRAGEGTLRGGRAEEEAPGSTGRMCLRSMLVHPIKWEHPSELEDYP